MNRTRFHLFWLEVVVSFYGWWLAPNRQVEVELDEMRYVGILLRLGATTFALEGLVAILILQYLAGRGQL